MTNELYFPDASDTFPALWRYEGFSVYQIDVTTAAVTGNAAVTSTDTITGRLVGFYYDDGDVTATTTAVITTITPVAVQLDSYDVDSGDAYRPIQAISPDTDLYDSYPLHTKILVTVTGGQPEKTFSVYVVFR